MFLILQAQPSELIWTSGCGIYRAYGLKLVATVNYIMARICAFPMSIYMKEKQGQSLPQTSELYLKMLLASNGLSTRGIIWQVYKA